MTRRSGATALTAVDSMGEESHPAPLLMYAIKQVELAVRAHLEDLLKPAGVTTLQYTALTVLERGGPQSAAGLARHSFVTAQSMADMVGVLTRKGLIKRTRDTTDKKRLLISLTAKGKRLLDTCREDVAALDQQMTGSLTARQRESLRRGLNECRAALSAL
jgi:DNA-binding MarR family transcriptional regulator